MITSQASLQIFLVFRLKTKTRERLLMKIFAEINLSIKRAKRMRNVY